MQRVYTVKQVVGMTGLTAATLRIWERRYGVVNPRRTAGHYRIFSEADVARLRAMVQLIEAGATAGKAAEIVKSQTLVDEHPPPEAPEVAPDELARLAKRLDVAGMSDLLAHMLTLTGFEWSVDEWLMPAVLELDRLHAASQLTRAHHRSAERAIKRRLGTLLDATRPSQRPTDAVNPIVLVGQGQEGGREMVPLAFTVALRLHDVDARYLGGGIDHDAWLAAARQLRPRAVSIAVASKTGVEDAMTLADSLARLRPPITVWLGGEGLAQVPRHLRGRLPLDVRTSTQIVLSHLLAGYGNNADEINVLGELKPLPGVEPEQ